MSGERPVRRCGRRKGGCGRGETAVPAGLQDGQPAWEGPPSSAATGNRSAGEMQGVLKIYGRKEGWLADGGSFHCSVKRKVFVEKQKQGENARVGRERLGRAGLSVWRVGRCGLMNS